MRRDYAANEGWETFLSYEDTRQVDDVKLHAGNLCIFCVVDEIFSFFSFSGIFEPFS